MSIARSSHWGLAIGALAVFGCGGETASESLSRGQFAVIDGIPAPEATNVVLTYDQTDSTSCTGALIAPNVVIVSRTCVSDTPAMIEDCNTPVGAAHAPNQILVTNDQELGGAPTVWGVGSVVVPSDDAICGNDIALLVLSAVVDASEVVPVEPRIDAPVTVGEVFTAYGYGPTTAGGSDSGIRRKLDGIAVTCAGDCVGAVAGEWGAGIGSCTGDGPAIGEDNLLMGLVSRGTSDCSASLYEGLEVHADWLREQIVAAAATGGYTPPAWAGGPDGGAGGASGGGGAAGSGATAGSSGAAGAAGSGGTGGTAGTAGTGGGTGTAGTSGSPSSSASADEDDGGCSCMVGNAGTRPGFLLFAVAALAACGRRRR